MAELGGRQDKQNLREVASTQRERFVMFQVQIRVVASSWHLTQFLNTTFCASVCVLRTGEEAIEMRGA